MTDYTEKEMGGCRRVDARDNKEGKVVVIKNRKPQMGMIDDNTERINRGHNYKTRTHTGGGWATIQRVTRSWL